MAGPPPEPWPTGCAQTLEPMVRRVLAPNPSAFTHTGTQSYLIGGEAGLAVIDPGPALPDHLAALLAAIGTAPVLAICCTHTHRDHSPAARPLAAATGAPIVGCAALVPTSGDPRADAPFDTDYLPDRVLSDGEQVSGPGWTLTAISTPGHTSNHLCFALEGTGVVFSGDHVMGWSTSVVAPPDGDMGAYIKSLAKLGARDDRIYYPGHGPAVDNPRQYVRALIGHRRQRERQILSLLGAAPADIAALVPRMYKGTDERLWPAAGQSVAAHLIDLERRGLVAHAGDMWQIAA